MSADPDLVNAIISAGALRPALAHSGQPAEFRYRGTGLLPPTT